MASSPTLDILAHTAELCANVIPTMENNTVSHITSNVVIGDYTVGITITKGRIVQSDVLTQSQSDIASSILRKRHYSIMNEE